MIATGRNEGKGAAWMIESMLGLERRPGGMGNWVSVWNKNSLFPLHAATRVQGDEKTIKYYH